MEDNREVQDTSDYKLDKHGKKIKAHRIVFNKGEDDGKKGVSEQMKKTYKDFVEQHTAELTEEQKDEIIAELTEALNGDLSAGEWIRDFVKSDNPKFEGKSKEKRKQMALAAYYAKQRNEEVELSEEATHTVDIDHMGGHDDNAKKHNITLKKTGKTDYSHDATGTKKNLQKFLAKHYDDHKEAKDLHPEVFKEELKGSQHKLDKNKNGKLDKHDFKLLRKEDAEQVDEAESHQSKTTMKHVSNPTAGEKKAAKDIKPGIAGYRDRVAMLNSAKARGGLKEEEAMEESVFDWKNKPRETSDSSKTKTFHNVKKTSTGTVYTKQFDKDGISKGTGDDAAKKAEGAAKRGRGRPKKDKFAEAVEFLLALSEEHFDDMMEEGFDAFIEAYEQLDELSKTTLGSYAKKASASAVSHTAAAQHSTAQAQSARERAKNPKLAFARSGNETIAKMQADRAVKSNVKAGTRLSGVKKAVDRLTK